jgi:phytoene desaturase
MRIVIVGAGLAGLATACHLAGQHDSANTGRSGPGGHSGRTGKRRHEIVVVEREDIPGGRAGVFESDGYRIDTGPSVMTMVDILEGTFAAAGASLADHVTLQPLDPMYRACFEDGSELRVKPGRDAMTEEIRRFAGAAEAAKFAKFADWLTELYSVEAAAFIDRNFDSVLDMAKPLRPGLQLLRLGGFRKLHKLVEGHFDDPRLQRIFSFQALYAGLSPFQALGAYAVITYMDTIAGVTFPKGGMHAIARGLAEAAEKAGVSFRYGETVDRVVRANGDNGAVRGVRLASGEVIAADAVVLNPDLPVAYRELLPGVDAPRKARTGNFSPSCALWLAGVNGPLPDGVAHHNIHFGSQWEKAFDALVDDGTRMPDPSILITVQTHSDPSLAPPGRHILYVLEPIPNLNGRINWDTERARVQADLQAHAARLGYPALAEQVEVERFIDPADWERMGMHAGTPFALSHRFFQTGPFRPNNIDKRVPGLVFTGSGTVPGVGVPMVLLSGRLAAERIAQMA